ncbi:hypothetical protein EYF80_052508 [Liparis tanakae]|uniref:Uncharacterized protein n=1 Tax=Liparis tanakae TaxID=230148 RepID=A0A4Z2F8J5_9TELE|nr:hypothetical protein EYF80_052508 [Liparis tanakae]
MELDEDPRHLFPGSELVFSPSSSSITTVPPAPVFLGCIAPFGEEPQSKLSTRQIDCVKPHRLQLLGKSQCSRCPVRSPQLAHGHTAGKWDPVNRLDEASGKAVAVPSYFLELSAPFHLRGQWILVVVELTRGRAGRGGVGGGGWGRALPGWHQPSITVLAEAMFKAQPGLRWKASGS